MFEVSVWLIEIKEASDEAVTRTSRDSYKERSASS